MRKKSSFIKLIQLWGVIFLIAVGGSIVALDIISSYRDFNSSVDKMREDYISNQKQIIKREVNYVVDMINHEKTQSDELTKSKVKARVYEAYSIAQNIYHQNIAKNKDEIQQMILDALRPIRFEQGNGYYFISRSDGVAILFPSNPEMEGTNLLELQDTHGQYVIKDEIQIAEESGEGFYQYHCTKPDEERKEFQKISFIKQFEPFNWFIGTGLYVDDVEEQIKADLLLRSSKVRFGKEGYIFINRLNGDALVSNGKLLSGTKKLWEVFNKNPEKMKSIFKKEYNAAIKPEGDYIYYSFIKLTDPNKDSPKASFIYGITEWKWIVGAGVYLDDVEADIAVMYKQLNDQIKMKTLYFILIIIGIAVLYLFLFQWLTRRLKKDFNMFSSFFRRAAHSDEEVNLDTVQFVELDRIAENANKMLQDKLHARQDLLDERERLFVTIQSIGDGLITTDLKGRIELMNVVAEQLTGWKAIEVQGKPLSDVFTIVNARTREDTENPVKRVLENGEIVGLADHTMLISRDGAEHQIADSAAPIKDVSGKTTGVVFVFRDITKEYKMRENLRQSEANLRTVFEAAKNVAFVKADCGGKEAKIIEFSPGAEDIFGYKSEEVVGRPVAILHLQEYVEKLPEIIMKMRKNKTGVRGESTLVRKSGEKFPALFTTHPVFDDDGEMTATLGVSIDITERKKAEEELRKMEKLKSIGILAGGIAHDFNNILTGIYGNISMAKEEMPMNNPGVEFLKEAESSMARATRLTEQLLTFAKGGEPLKEDVSIGALVEEVVRFDLSGSNVKPVFDQARDLWMAEADKSQMQQIFSNLTINANQAMPDGGHLFITLENADISKNATPGLDQGKYIRITVEDEGTGIEQKHLERIFDPYFSTKQAGSGLGLTTVYSIIKKHGGHIGVDSEIGRGTIFKIYLPASQSQQPGEIRQSTEEGQARKQTGRVLVMDDEDMILRLVTRILGKSNFSIKTASGGRKTIEMYKQALDAGEPFDVVIMDITVPGGMGGREAVKEILKINSKARVIVSSGYANDPIMANYAEYGFKGIVAKPYTRSKLLEVLNQVLGE